MSITKRDKKYAIFDTFHPFIDDEEPLVTSDMFDCDEDFFTWCRQHAGDNSWHEVTRHPTLLTAVKEYPRVNPI